ncbi:TPA: restriction endonuclease subunit S [Klebsiella aerogenes]|nr:restriction endonuclease subunit S [Klebsiella aerogenes]
MIAPKLRFSKFSKEWTKIRLGDYLQIYQKKVSSDTNIPVYSSSRQGLKPQAEYFADRELKNDGEYGVVPLGYITYRHMSDDNTFHFNLNDKIPEIAVSKEYPVFTGKGLNNYFLLSKLNYTNEFKLFAIQQKAGGTRTRLYFKNLCEWYATFPEFEEQTKIADFLSSVDEKITLLDKQYKQLCQYKKGMMQKIFNQELRFKDDRGDEFSDWEEVELKKIASKVNTKNRDNSVITVLTNSATQGIVIQESYFEREIVTESNLTGYYVVRIGDFVYNPRISSTAPVGPIKINELVQGVMSPLYTVFRFEKGLLKFYKYFFESSVWHDYMKSVANSGARHDRMNISGADFFDLPVPQPSDEEQTKIARFLSAIDDKITTKKAALDKLKAWKQGLLQQMFV